MSTTDEPRVAVYFDFDNIVISRYDEVHGESAYRSDTSRSATITAQTEKRLAEANVDIDAILDYATTFGTIALARAYADWSTRVNASYRRQLINRAFDLVQLFPLVRSLKNGADIRLSVDAMEDMFRLEDITHIVIVAGDSDYVALAQKAKLLGRYVVGIGVSGGTSSALAAACDEFADYGALLTTETDTDTDEAPASPDVEDRTTKSGRKTSRTAVASQDAGNEPASDREQNTQPRNPSKLLVKAIELLRTKNDQDWQESGAVKSQMQRMDSSFQERNLGFSTFTDFVKSRGSIVELDDSGTNLVRIRPKKE